MSGSGSSAPQEAARLARRQAGTPPNDSPEMAAAIHTSLPVFSASFKAGKTLRHFVVLLFFKAASVSASTGRTAAALRSRCDRAHGAAGKHLCSRLLD